MAIVYEGLKAARQWIKRAVKHRQSRQLNSGRETPDDDVPMILGRPAFINGLVCTGLVFI